MLDPQIYAKGIVNNKSMFYSFLLGVRMITRMLHVARHTATQWLNLLLFDGFMLLFMK